MVGIIIPTKNNTAELFKCIESIEKTTHVPYRIYVADTGSNEEVLGKMVEFFADHNGGGSSTADVVFMRYDYYNYAKINNDVVRKIDPDVNVLLFCNNDIELSVDGTIDRMLELLMKNLMVVGTVGCRLVYPNGTIQHDGQFFKTPVKPMDGLKLGHVNQYKDNNSDSYQRNTPSVVDGNTFALCMTHRSLFVEIGMLSEEYIECFEDVQYNMECNIRGRINIIPESAYWAYHHESLTRGKTPESMERLHKDYMNILLFVSRML